MRAVILLIEKQSFANKGAATRPESRWRGPEFSSRANSGQHDHESH